MSAPSASRWTPYPPSASRPGTGGPADDHEPLPGTVHADSVSLRGPARPSPPRRPAGVAGVTRAPCDPAGASRHGRRTGSVRTVVPVGGLLDPQHLITTFGLLGLLFVVFAECGLLVGFFLPGDSLLFVGGLVAAGGLTGVSFVPLWVLLVLVPIA